MLKKLPLFPWWSRFMFLCCLLIFNGGLSAQTVYNFTNAGASGRQGPTQAMLNTAYTGTTLNGKVTMNALRGIQQFTVPVAGRYSLEVWGAGANGSFGAKIKGEFNFTQGQVLYIAVGQQGVAAGGNGGSFVSTGASLAASTPVIVAGGGAGTPNEPVSTLNITATYNNNGNNGNTGLGGTNGSGGQTNKGNGPAGGGGGGGFYGNGINTSGYGRPGKSFINGAEGADVSMEDPSIGGFGGGGSGFTHNEPAGGGGYSGGGGGGYQDYSGAYASSRYGGGGGSFNSGLLPTNLGITNIGNGKVVLTHLFSAGITQTASILCNGSSTGALSVSVSGGVAPYTYLWSNGGKTDAISGLSAGLYTVTVTDAGGKETSTSFSLTQPAPVSITGNPSNSSIISGSNAAFTTSATGSSLVYQWQLKTGSDFTDISNSGVYSNATTATLNITGAPAAMNGTQYRCVVRSGTCEGKTSTSATLTVNKRTQAITGFNLGTITYGDAAPLLSASANSGLLVAYTSSDPDVATVNNNIITIVGVGTTQITASQSGNDSYEAATDVVRTLTVNPKSLSITAHNRSKSYGETFTFSSDDYTVNGLINGNMVNSLTITSTGSVAGAVVASTPYAIVISDAIGSGLENYLINYVPGELTVNRRGLTVVNSNRSKTYGEVLLDADFSGSISGVVNNDNITVSRNSTGAIATAGSGMTYPIVATVQDPNNKLANYILNNQNGLLTVAKKVLTITAENKEKFAGTANPPLTVSYSDFANNETAAVFTTQPAVTTTATSSSPIGDYPITVSGAVAANYDIRYIAGNLKIKPVAPTSIALSGVVLYENNTVGTNAGTLSSTSDDPSATFTYTLVTGTGDIDNARFTINGNKVNAAAVLDFETKSTYRIRVRSTTQHGLSLEREMTIVLTDVNESPTLEAVANQVICFTTSAQTIRLTGISAGPESGQTTVLSVASNNADLFEDLTVAGSGATGAINYRIKSGAVAGTAVVTITVKDNGGTANGGVDTYSKTFVITVNALPIVSINSNKGAEISKGETVLLSATGGSTYVWADANGIISGRNSAVLEVRPRETTTYTVTATNASECSETKTFTLTVLDDLAKIKATNIMSPNGDGINDKWVVENIDFYPNNEVKIFDKAGRFIYSKKGYDNSWDATLNGMPLAEGTYYYVIDFGVNRRKIKGFITVVRQN